MKVGRNDPCVCGSGKKFKYCCGGAPVSAPAGPPNQDEIGPILALLRSGQFAESERAARDLLARDPACGFAWKVLGASLSVQAKDGLEALQKATLLLPDDPETHTNLGYALWEAGRLDEAVACHRRALEIDPQRAEVHNNLGNALRDQWLPEQAMASYRRALEIKPDYALAHSNLAILLRVWGRSDEAEASCRRALDLNPHLIPALTLWAEIHSDNGLFSEAQQLLESALRIDGNSALAWAGIAQLRKMSAGDAAWLQEASRVVERKLPMRHEVRLRYAIGKYFDDIGEYDSAFASYERANELLKRYSPSYDRQDFAASVDRIIRYFDGRWLDLARNSSDSARPVFIVGMPRSGTTLVEQILASHPAVYGAGELPYWNEQSRRWPLKPLSPQTSSETVREMGAGYLRLLDRLAPDALRVVDKMPGNFLCLGLIHAALPNARIIHVRRNPIDTCLSNYFQHFENAHAYSHDLGDLAHYYRQYVRLMVHWRSVLAQDTILEVPYEALVANQESWSRRMLAFIGLPWDARCLEFHRNTRTVITASKWQVRQQITSASVERWRRYERFVGPLQALLELDWGATSLIGQREASLGEERKA